MISRKARTGGTRRITSRFSPNCTEVADELPSGCTRIPKTEPNAETNSRLDRACPQDSREHGDVQFSYPASYESTLRGNWGYEPKSTRKFSCGAALLFDQDAYAAEVMGADCPAPDTMEACNNVFNRTAALLREALSLCPPAGNQDMRGHGRHFPAHPAQPRLGSSRAIREEHEGL